MEFLEKNREEIELFFGNTKGNLMLFFSSLKDGYIESDSIVFTLNKRNFIRYTESNKELYIYDDMSKYILNYYNIEDKERIKIIKESFETIFELEVSETNVGYYNWSKSTMFNNSKLVNFTTPKENAIWNINTPLSASWVSPHINQTVMINNDGTIGNKYYK